MRSVTPRNPWVLMLLIAAATILAATVPGDAAARSHFQSSPQAAAMSPISPLTPTASPTTTATASPGFTPTTQASPHAQQAVPAHTIQPAPAQTRPPATAALTAAQRTATAVAASFLPAPTLTSPEVIGPIARLPGSQPLNAPPAPRAATPAPTGSGLGQWMDNGLVLASLLWLCFGAVAVAGIAVGAFWYFRKHL